MDSQKKNGQGTETQKFNDRSVFLPVHSFFGCPFIILHAGNVKFATGQTRGGLVRQSIALSSLRVKLHARWPFGQIRLCVESLITGSAFFVALDDVF
jgi:hypothetical protein